MGSICCCLIFNVDLLILSKMSRGPQWVLYKGIFGNWAALEQNLDHFLSFVLVFCLNNFHFEKTQNFEKFILCQNFSRIHKNELTYKLCTILEWDKCQQFADFIKFGVFRFSLTQLCKTFVQFFMNKTLLMHSEQNIQIFDEFEIFEK